MCEKEGFSNIALKSLPVPQLRSPEDDYKVLIKLICSSVNPVDYKRCCMGNFGFPTRLGSDIVGKIIDLGSKVDSSKFMRGKTHVLCFSNLNEKSLSGSFSEYTVEDSRYLSIIPEKLL